MVDTPANQKVETPPVPEKRTAVCIQLRPEWIELARKSAKTLVDLHAVTLLDGARLEALAKNADIILCYWDGQGGRAHRFMAAFLASGVKAGSQIYMINDAEAPKEPLSKRKLNVTAWFTFPLDLYRLDSVFFDETAEPEPDPQLTAAGGKVASGPRMLQVPRPPHVGEREVVEKIKAAAAAREAHGKQIQEAKAKDEERHSKPYHTEPIYVFHEDQAGAAGVLRRLNELGCLNAQTFVDARELFLAIRERPPRILLLWYGPEHSRSSSVLKTLTEARDIARFGVGFLCPGDDALKQLALETSEAFFDRVALIAGGRSALEAAIDGLLTESSKASGPRAALEVLRKPWRLGSKDPERKPLTGEALDAACAEVARAPGKAYWAKSERILNLILGGNPAARAEAEALQKDYPRSFDAAFIQCVSRAASEGTKAMGEEIVRAALSGLEVSEERCFRLGKWLCRVRAKDALANLIEGWLEREDFVADHQLWYLVSRYYRLVGNRDQERLFIYAAAAAAPCRADYVLALAEYFEVSKTFGVSAALAAQAAKLAHAERASCFVVLARSLEAKGRSAEALAIFDSALRDAKDPELVQLRNRLVAVTSAPSKVAVGNR